jgi:hypothetical protein
MTAFTEATTSSATAEWYSPADIIEPARLVFGAFDLDPASCEEANELVRAAKIFTTSDDGKRQRYDIDGKPSRVWWNPPSQRGDKLKGISEESVGDWWVHLGREWLAGRVRAAACVFFNISSVQVCLRASRLASTPAPQWCTRAEPASRIKYYSPGAKSNSPPHASAILLLSDEPELHTAWTKAYTHLGEVLPPSRMPTRDQRAKQLRIEGT